MLRYLLAALAAFCSVTATLIPDDADAGRGGGAIEAAVPAIAAARSQLGDTGWRCRCARQARSRLSGYGYRGYGYRGVGVGAGAAAVGCSRSLRCL